MSYENFIHHRDLSNSRSMAKAQAAHDSQATLEDTMEECPVCEGTGMIPNGDTCSRCDGEGKVCEHKWKFAGRAKDGTEFTKCTKCGIEVEK